MASFLRTVCLASLAVSLSLAASACASQEPEDAATSEAELTRSVVSYGFTKEASLGYLQGLSLGASRDGAMLLAEDYAPNGNVTTPKLWNGTQLTAIGAGPFYASGTFAYDAATGTTYFLQYSGRAPNQYESLFRYDASGFRQLYSGRFGGAYANLVFDSTRKVLLRVAKGSVQRWDGAGQQAPYSARWSNDGVGPDETYDPNSATFDEKRGVLVLLSGAAPLERPSTATGVGAWSKRVPTVVPPQPAGSTGGAVGGCSAAVYDSINERVVGVCMTTSRGARIVEWDGQKLQVGTLANGDRLWGPKTFAFDRVNGVFVAADPDRFYTLTRTVQTVPNGAPTLTSAKSAQIYATEEASVPVVAADADLDQVTVTLVNPPAGAVLDGNVLRWTPSVADEGKRKVKVRLSDGESTVEQTLELNVKVLRYTNLPTGAVARNEHFWVSGPGTLRGQSRNTHGEITCTLTGMNPGVIRAQCGITAEICGDYDSHSSPCSVAWARGVSAASIVSEDGSFGESRSQSRTCPQCGRWSSNVRGTVKPNGICVSYTYQTDVFMHGNLGTAESRAQGCNAN